METLVKSGFLLVALSLMVVTAANAQKKVQTFTVERVIDLPADKVWQIVGVDYGAIAHSHPKIISSDYTEGTLKAGEGAERVCHFNEKGTQFLKEKMVNYDPSTMSFTNTVYQTGKFPVDPEVTQAVYKVVDLGNGQSKFVFDMQYRTKPAFMGSMMKGKFKKLIEDYAISIEHHGKTGESVTKDNFKEIKKKYKS